MSPSPDSLLSPDLRKIWNVLGAKFRFPTSGAMDLRQQQDMLDDSSQAIHRCRVQLEERYKAPGCFEAWAREVRAKLEADIKAIPFGKTPEDAVPIELRGEILHLTPALEHEI